MNIQIIELKKLKRAEYNPRKQLTPKDKEYQQLKRSIVEFGFVVPVVINKDFTVIGGHQGLTVLEDLGYKKVECNILDLDKNQEKALNLALNKIDGIWDYDKLENVLAELKGTDIDLNVTGFDFDEVDDILKDLMDSNPKEEDKFDVEKALNEIEEPSSKVGDIYLLGNNRLMCGDSTKKEDVEKLMSGNKANMIFTDPPYNADYSSRVDTDRRKPWGGLINDNMTYEQYENFVTEFNKMISEFSVDGASIYECIDWKHYSQLEKIFRGLFEQKSMIVWNKNCFGLGTYYRTKYELILFGTKGDKVNTWNAKHNEMDVWDENRENVNNYVHPTQKPITIPARAIRNSSKQDDIVLDLFGGSGTTLIASEQLKRKCYMMELDRKYCDVIIKRWEALTGKKAVLEAK